MYLTKLLAGSAIALICATGATVAQDYPNRNLEFIVPFPPGGASNLIGRAISSEMAQDLGRTITVLNREGAAGTVGAAELARAEPDGYTIGILTSTPLLMRPHTADLPYDLSSFDLICRAFDNPLILTVTADSGIDSLEQLIEMAQAQPGSIRYYTEGPGSLQDIAMGTLQASGDFTAVGVPMTGHQAAVQNLLSGVIAVAPLTAGEVLGNPDLLKGIAIMSRNRVPEPDVPTIAEVLGDEIVYSLGGAIVAPVGLPEDRRARLEQACAYAQRSEGFNETLQRFHMPPADEVGAAFAEAYTDEYNAIGDYIREHGAGAD